MIPKVNESVRNGTTDPGHQRRADLQGLRALAVLPVVAFHFEIPGIPGGFIGVDVFFVLSGFFITRLLMRELDGGHIRLPLFWANRTKRLLPNALLTIVCTLMATVLLLPSYRLPGISQEAVAAILFFANFHFALEAVDYFNLGAPQSPLMHYWSLAVEEQFYLVLPLLMSGLVLLKRKSRRATVISLLTAVAVLSFGSSLIAIQHSQPAAFFYPQNRAWQLALGGLVGLAFNQRHALPQLVRAALAFSGFTAIIASIVLIGDDLAYPGMYALTPTVGTAALVLGVDADCWRSGPGRLLSCRPAVWIGDISYSLYLWHWPVAVFIAALFPSAGAAVIAAGILLSLLLAAAAYYLVERPIHRMKMASASSPRLLGAGATGLVVVAVAATGVSALPGRTDTAITARIAAAIADLGPNYANGCHRPFEAIDQPDCRFGRLGGPRVVLFGDSHAAQWFSALARAGEEAGWEVIAWTKTGCPSANVSIWYPPTRSIYEQCMKWRDARLTAILEEPPQIVVLGNSSNNYGWIYDLKRGRAADRAVAEAIWLSGFENTAKRLIDAGIQVVEVRDTPIMYLNYKACLSVSEWSACYRGRNDALAGMPTPSIVSSLYSVLDLTDKLCDAEKCPATAGNHILYRDNEHLTASYARLLYEPFLKVLVSASRELSGSPKRPRTLGRATIRLHAPLSTGQLAFVGWDFRDLIPLKTAGVQH